MVFDVESIAHVQAVNVDRQRSPANALRMVSRLVADTQPTELKGYSHLGKDEEAGRRLAPAAAYPPSMAEPAVRRQTPEVGAVCGKAARTDLCGGRGVTRVPTATAGGMRERRSRIARLRRLSGLN
jgi:hypothetical protein